MLRKQLKEQMEQQNFQVRGGVQKAVGGRLESVKTGTGISPLQGSKIVITNLQTWVTEGDVLELFGDIGAVRRAKLVTPGHAEVTFVNKKDALKAVDIYHNRQLDGKPMKCQIIDQSSSSGAGGSFKLPPFLAPGRRTAESGAPPPDMEAIHRALFNKNKDVGKKPLFTITMPKKSKDEQ